MARRHWGVVFRALFLALGGWGFAASVVGAWPAPTISSDIDVERYRFRLAVGDSNDEIEGEASIVLRAMAAGVARVVLDLVDPDDRGVGMRVQRIGSRDPAGVLQPLVFLHQAARLDIELLRPLAEGERAELVVTYSGHPADGLIIGENRHGERTFFGDNWPQRARYWLPTVDHPSDKALVEFVVEAPSRYQVIASGRLRKEVDLPGERRLTVYESEVPMASKVMVVGIARFAVRHEAPAAGVELESWAFAADQTVAFADFEMARPVLEFFVDRFGPFPYEKLANVQSRTRFGGMENAGNIFYAEGLFGGDRSNEAIIAHEIAHQWFGDAVSEADWSDLWLSEGFATYAAAAFREHQHGRESLDETLMEDRQRVREWNRENPGRAVIEQGAPADSLNLNTYRKGAWVLHMLRQEIGETAFWRTLREYVRRYMHGNATTRDFRDVAQEQCMCSLVWFFEQWLDRPGLPVLAVERHGKAGNGETLEIRQIPRQMPGPRQAAGARAAAPETAQASPYRLRLDLELLLQDGSRERRQVVLGGGASEVPLPAIGLRSYRLDPDTHLLFDVVDEY